MGKRGTTVIGFLILFSLITAFFSIGTVMAIGGSWTLKAPMHEPRCMHGVAVVNGKIYAIGGSKIHIAGKTHFLATINATEAYDPATNTWTERAQMPTPRSQFGIAVYENKIYCVGGGIGNGRVTGVTEVYDPETDTWETKASMPTARDQLQANVVNGKIYLIGGNPKGALNEVYDPATDSWITKEPIPTAVTSYASALLDNKIYVIAGKSNHIITNLTQIYDTETDIWSSGVPIPNGVDGAAACATTGIATPKAIYVIGGGFTSNPLHAQNITQLYFPENNSWGMGASLPVYRFGLGVTVVNDVIYAIGGGHNVFLPDSTDIWQNNP